ncbi:MAG: trehalose-6-phosphate synthase [Candidatus Margulisbacteria bacterium]|nr:trehalose-6-phosphate synthase [Candidatus Margulisiibacteriota bacterium]MBU1021621.1 trehalose-6-phosphate synthase [Candidatus Margulisiibacteriota bacterium]MBU1728771.1 trehalose-6-phosphate synthase [Candidatus Margulisiibacteriota bacterium]MBU1955737.1 trehalose-6-phosphate synthase [Candidatus Margulisiibacteriota bacterium]
MVSSKETLKELVNKKLKKYTFVVASNREPYIHTYSGDKIICIKPASGVTTALDPVLRASKGIWVAHGAGDADKKVVDGKNRIQVPPDNPEYTLRRIWMNKAEEDGYYYGFSNETLWPLCHIVYNKPKFDETDWKYYKLINERFAKTVIDEIDGKQAIVFLQDYHLTLAPKMIKEANPNAKVALFWHIPWPNPEVFRICPWKKEIIEGMLGADLLGFHIGYHVDNFLETVNQTVEAQVDKIRPSITMGGHKTLIRPYPISVDAESISAEADSPEIEEAIKNLRHTFDLNYEFIGVGADRVDYTKGIPERFKAIDLFLEKNPKYHKKFVYIQAGSLSRIHITDYKDINDEINDLVENINWKYSSDHWTPIILVRRHFSSKELIALFKLANFCVVSSLHDGMNLVAKEYVSACDAEKGALILSQFTGASRELADAIMVNPYAPASFADAIKLAIEMPKEEKAERMRRMKETVRENNIYRWAENIIQTLLKI